MKKLTLLACAILLIQTSAAQAAIVGVSGLLGGVFNPFGVPDAGLNGTNFVSIVLGVQATEGEAITALDVSITGPVHQRWADSDEDGTFEQSATGSTAAQFANPRGDSFLSIPPFAAVAVAATEDNSFVGSPLTSTATRKYGIGTTMGFAAGFDPLGQVNFAYLVTEESNLRSLNGLHNHAIKVVALVATRDSTGNPGPTIQLNECDFPFAFYCLPEPSSAALVVFASLALVNRQGRRAGLAVVG